MRDTALRAGTDRGMANRGRARDIADWVTSEWTAGVYERTASGATGIPPATDEQLRRRLTTVSMLLHSEGSPRELWDSLVSVVETYDWEDFSAAPQSGEPRRAAAAGTLAEATPDLAGSRRKSVQVRDARRMLLCRQVCPSPLHGVCTNCRPACRPAKCSGLSLVVV